MGANLTESEVVRIIEKLEEYENVRRKQTDQEKLVSMNF